jgi:hypothetical protein
LFLNVLSGGVGFRRRVWSSRMRVDYSARRRIPGMGMTLLFSNEASIRPHEW